MISESFILASRAARVNSLTKSLGRFRINDINTRYIGAFSQCPFPVNLSSMTLLKYSIK